MLLAIRSYSVFLPYPLALHTISSPEPVMSLTYGDQAKAICTLYTLSLLSLPGRLS